MTVVAVVAALLLVLALAAAVLRPAPADAATAETVPGQLVVGFAPTADAADRAEARAAADVDLVRPLGGAATQLVEADGSVAAAAAELERQPGVAFAEPNWVVRATADPLQPQQWGLSNTGQRGRDGTGVAGADVAAHAAWGAGTGSTAVTLAVVDTGIDLDHPDLAGSLWTNPAPGRTGCGEDLHGCDFTTAVPTADPDDDNGHGTHVSGIAGAPGDNGAGGAGLCWGCRLLTAKALGADGSGSTAAVAAAISYATQRGARVVNLSLGSTGESLAVKRAIRNAPSVLFVAAAGNGDAAGNGIDVDVKPEYPCATDAANIVCVAATDRRDALGRFSNYGDAAVDLGAPGVDIVSDYPGGGYAAMSGTSMAAPFVAGAAGLLLSARPAATVAQLRAALLAGADRIPSLAGKTVSGGRLDVAGALTALTGSAPPPAPAAPAAEPATPVPSPDSDVPAADPGAPSEGEAPAEETPPAEDAPADESPADEWPESEWPDDEWPADDEPAPRPAPSRPVASPPAAAPIATPVRNGRLHRRVARVTLRCPAGASACRGQLVLRERTRRGRAAVAPRELLRTTFVVAAGADRTLRLPLPAYAVPASARRALTLRATVVRGTRAVERAVVLTRR